MRKENRFPDGTPIDPWFDEPDGLSRSEGENCMYFPALINAIGLEGLDITAADISCDETAVENLVVRDVRLTKKEQIDYPDSVTTL